MKALRKAIVAASLFLVTAVSAAVAAQAPDGRAMCKIEVLKSEELPGAPIYQNLIKATLLVEAPGSPPFETTVVKLIPYQVPPPRQGQRLTAPCDPDDFGFHLFR
jgi:hypothetical protein